jgi:adenine-specific DNA-methyltransferase
MSKFNSLVTKLREVFQIDRPDLDFGIYRIMNSRAEQITRYLENDLREKVATSLSSVHSVRIAEIVEKLAEAEKNAFALGMEPDMVSIVKNLRAELADLRNNDPGHEDALFSHLLTFFSRYYEKGDYISKRRYKGDTYAIPYSGEEVVLHWANKDQYYTKSGESFTNYSFKLDDGRTVRFRLLAADTAKGSVWKSPGEKHRPIPRYSLLGSY